LNTVRTVAKNTLTLTLSDIVNKVFSLILVIYIAKYLGDVNFGKYSFAFAFAGFFLIFADAGLNTLIVRDVAQDRIRAAKYLGNILIIKTILSIIVLAMIVSAIAIMKYPQDTAITVYIVGLSLIVGSISGSFHSIFSAYEQMEYIALISTIGKIIFVALGIAVLVSGYGLLPFVSIFLLSNVIGFLLSGFLSYKRFTKPVFEIDFGFWKYLIKNGMPFLLTGMFASVYFYIDTIMLSFMKGDAVVGWYNAAYNLLAALIPVLALFMSVMFPVFSKFFKTSKKDLNIAFSTSIRYLFIFTLPIVVGTSLISENLIYFLYGTVFTQSILTLQILIWALLFISMSIVFSTMLNSTNRQMLVTKATACGAVINVGLNLLLIPGMSLIGASIATVITEASLFFLYYYFISKYHPVGPIYKIVYKPVIAVLLMGLSVIYLRDANIFLIISFAAFIYASALFMIKGFTKDDLRLFSQIIGRGT
jgi:O-antigen/teichoic acid export membrane protein